MTSILYIFLLITASSLAHRVDASECLRSLNGQSLELQTIKQILRGEKIARQCAGTCSIESTSLLIQEQFQRTQYKDIDVDRLEILKRFAINRFKSYQKKPDSKNAQISEEKYGAGNIISSSTAIEVIDSLKGYSTPPVRLKKTYAEVEKENRSLVTLSRSIQSFVIQYKIKFRQLLIKELAPFLRQNGDELSDYLFNSPRGNEEKWSYDQIIYLVRHLNRIQEGQSGDLVGLYFFFSSLSSLSEQENIEQKFQSIIAKKEALDRINLEKLTELLWPKSAPHPLLNLIPRDQQKRVNAFINSLDFKVSISSMGFDTQNLVDHLGLFKVALLGYHHNHDDEKSGILKLPEDSSKLIPLDKRTLQPGKGGAHGVVIIDYFKNLNDGKIYFIAKNSHGKSSGVYGLLLISEDYLRYYGYHFIVAR